MGKTSISYFKLLAVALLLMCGTAVAYAEKTVADLDGKDWERYEMFRHLFLNGTPEEFYSYANEYAAELHKKGYMMLYYKLLSNKGFFALRHNQIYRAIQFAEALDHEVREDKASDYYYLATGLYGDIYSSSHDKTRGETYFKQALEEVGDRDVKFTMRVYLNLAEMFCLKDPQKSLKWVDQSIATAQKVKNIDYLSMSLAMKAYIHFITGDAQQFVVDENHVVAVPMDAAAHMQQQAALLAADGGNLVADVFRRMEMAGIQTNKNILPGGIRQIEVGGTDGAAFRADAEQLRFDGVQFVFVTDFLRKAFVQRFQKPLAGGIAVGRSVFVTIWCPEVHDARRAQFLAELRADLAAGLAVVDPELADGGIRMGQRQAMVQFRMRIERGGDVESDLVRLRPIQPAAVVVQRETVAIHAGEHLVHLMGLQADAMLAWNKLQGHFQIGAQFV